MHGEREVDEGDGRFRAIFASAPECIKRVGPDGRLIDMNPAGLRMIGAVSVEDIRGRCLIDLIEPAYHRAFCDAIDAVFRGRSVQLQFELMGLSGQRLWMDQSAAPLFDRTDSRRVVEMIAMTRDITSQRASEAEILRARVIEEVGRSKAQFLATVGNDLKTPLGQIIGYSELLKESSLENGRHEDLADIQRILAAANQLLVKLNQMLAISQADARDQAAGLGPFDLPELVDEATASVRAMLRAARAEIRVELENAPQGWIGDARKLDQCLRSVLSAAMEFAAHGAIRITALGVFDQGCPQLQIDIAAKGQRLEAAGGEGPANLVGPTALKLARSTVRVLGGNFKMSAEPDGVRFTVRIPAAPVTAQPFDLTAA